MFDAIIYVTNNISSTTKIKEILYRIKQTRIVNRNAIQVKTVLFLEVFSKLGVHGLPL